MDGIHGTAYIAAPKKDPSWDIEHDDTTFEKKWGLFNRRNHEKYDGIIWKKDKNQGLWKKHHHKSHRFRWKFVTSRGHAPSPKWLV